MKLKDKLIRKLLDAGKKHRILVYPTLALVAVITAISHAVYWSRGNGKKLVASVMIMVMLITQSLFLTSSADTTNPGSGSSASPTDAVTAADDTTDGGNDSMNLIPDDGENGFSDDGIVTEEGSDGIPEEFSDNLGIDSIDVGDLDPNYITVKYYFLNESNQIFSPSKAISKQGGHTIVDESITGFNKPTAAEMSAALFGDSKYSAYFEFSLYADTAGTELDGASIPLTDGTYEYNAYIKFRRTSYSVAISDEYGDGNYYLETSCNVDGTYGVMDPAVDVDVSSFSYSTARRGYTFAGYKLDSTGVLYTDIIPLQSTALDYIGITSMWTPMEGISVSFDAVDTSAPQVVQDAETSDGGTYDVSISDLSYSGTITLPDVGLTTEAYYLAGWKYTNSNGETKTAAPGDVINVSDVCVDDGDISANPNVKGITLVGVWEYKSIGLQAGTDNGDGVASVAIDNIARTITITGTYGDKIDLDITAYNLQDNSAATNNRFTYTVTGLVSPCGVNLVTYAGNDSRFNINGQFTDITTGVSGTLSVTDTNSSDTITYTIYLTSNKRQVKVAKTSVTSNLNSDPPTKEYDGTKTIGVAATAQLMDANADEETGSIIVDDVAVTFTSAELVEADASAYDETTNSYSKKAIILKGVSLTGNNADKYVLVGLGDDGSLTLDEVAIVKKKTVEIIMKLKDGSDNEVYFGEQSPEYYYILADSSAADLIDTDKARYVGLGDDSARDAYLRELLRLTDCTYTRNHIYSDPGEYMALPSDYTSEANYRITLSGGYPKFTVVRETAEKDIDYTYSTEMYPNGYYPGLTINPAGKYDVIRVLNAGEGDVNDPNGAYTWLSAYTFTESVTDQTLEFQLKNLDTGEVTYLTSDTFNVNLDPPVIYKYSVSPNINQYFNHFSFGSYYRAQDIDGVKVESFNMTVEYKSERSACTYLYYYFADEDGNPKGGSISKVQMSPKSGEDGIYYAEFPVGTGASGQIIVYAEDDMEYTSALSQLRIKTSDDSDLKETDTAEFNSNSYNKENDYYEWMVENKIESAQIVVTDASGMQATAGNWYSCLNFNIYTTDPDSGLNRVEWYITDPDGNTNEEPIIEYVDPAKAPEGGCTVYKKVTTYNFCQSVTGESYSVGEYYANAVIYDNAGNSFKLMQVGPYMLDSNPPVITYKDPYSSDYRQTAVLDFTAADGEGESGLNTVMLYKDSLDSDPVASWGNGGTYSYEITTNGNYIIVATDKAGNIAKTEPIKVDKLSSVKPATPTITVVPGDAEIGNDGWYIGAYPDVTINSEAQTTDGVDVETTYRITAGNNKTEKQVNKEEYTFTLSKEGTITIEAWSVSASGCESGVATETVKVDVDAPEVAITDSVTDSNGQMLISFTATDKVSGVNVGKVMVNGQPISVTNENGIIKGSFKANGSDTYTIVVEDIAGNVSEPIEYKPLGLYATPVTDVTTTSAYIEAKVFKGTDPITNYYIEYKKASDTAYERALFNKYSEDYGVKMTNTFRNLKPDTLYEYRVYASTALEERVITGSFRTLSNSSKATVYGDVSYDSALPDSLKTYPIFVNMYSGNTVIEGIRIENADDMSYMFKNVPDGSYRIVATNGVLSKETKVIITNGGISYPTDYAANDGINFVLSGLSTRVQIDGDVYISVDGLDKIYNTELYNGNVTDADLDVVKNGGTVEIILYASCINVSDVNKTTQSIFKDRIGADAVIEKYLQLYIVKEVKDASGNYVNGTPSNITRLAEPISVSFSLGELSGQKVYVASLHGNDTNYSFENWNSDSDIVITNSYVTIETDRFSVYALYRLLDAPKTYTVKWIDGDGNVMKTETVEEGEAATPPTETPTKTPTAKYRYVFAGWDTDYSCITKDTIIAAWFTAVEIENKDNNSNNSNNGSGSSSSSGTNNGSSSNAGTSTITYTYMGSADSPRTGDAAPIALVSIMMLFAASGVVVLRKKASK